MIKIIFSVVVINLSILCTVAGQGRYDDLLIGVWKGTLVGTFDSKQNELIFSPKPNTIWKFKLTNQKLEGTLYLNKELYRIISVTKSS